MIENITSTKYTIKQIFEDHWLEYLNIHSNIPKYILTNIDKMLNCRNPQKLGYHKYCCPNHINECTVVPHSCKSRICSSCGVNATNHWIAKVMQDFPNTPYYHVTLTMPDYLWYFFRDESKRPLLDLLFKASNEAVLDWFKNNRKVLPAAISTMHTFGKKINYNTHIHLMVSAGGIALDKHGKLKIDKHGNHVWKKVKTLKWEVLVKRWKAILIKKLDKYINDNLKNTIVHKNWYLNVKPKFFNASMTLKYIGRYTKRPAMAQTRITNYDGKWIAFYYEKYDNGIKMKKFMKLYWEEFITRLISHIPLPNFRMIRHSGIMAYSVKKKMLSIVHNLLNQTKKPLEWLNWRQRQIAYTGIDPLICKTCNKQMILEEVAFWSKKMAGLYIKGVDTKMMIQNLQWWIAPKMQFLKPLECFHTF